MALVALLDARRLATRGPEFPEIDDLQHAAIAIDVEQFLRVVRAAKGRVGQIGDAAVLESEDGDKIVVARVMGGLRPDRASFDACDRRAGEIAEEIVEMAGFADVASAARIAVRPVIERNVAGIDAVVRNEGVAAPI